MGALTELMDSYREEKGYYTARAEYRQLLEDYQLKDLSPEELEKIHDVVLLKYKGEKNDYEISRNLRFFLGLDVKKFFIFYPWTFGDELQQSVNQLKQICEDTPGLSCVERMSTDNDFFLFHPTEHGPGLEICDKLNRTPGELNDLFRGVLCSKREDKRLWFKW